MRRAGVRVCSSAAAAALPADPLAVADRTGPVLRCWSVQQWTWTDRPYELVCSYACYRFSPERVGMVHAASGPSEV